MHTTIKEERYILRRSRLEEQNDFNVNTIESHRHLYKTKKDDFTIQIQE